MLAERRIGKHDFSAGTDLLKAHASLVEASVEVDEAVGAVREIADFAREISRRRIIVPLVSKLPATNARMASQP